MAEEPNTSANENVGEEPSTPANENEPSTVAPPLPPLPISPHAFQAIASPYPTDGTNGGEETANAAPASSSTAANSATFASASSSLKPTKDWPQRIKDDVHATLSEDGKNASCKACLGKGKTKGIITMRHPFCIGAWDEHTGTRLHINGVANIEAENEKDNPFKNKKQDVMANYFKVKEKKKPGSKSVSADTSKSVSVDTSNPPSNRPVDVDLTRDIGHTYVPISSSRCLLCVLSISHPYYPAMSLCFILQTLLLCWCL